MNSIATCIFFLNLLFKQGYHARQAKSKCGWIIALLHYTTVSLNMLKGNSVFDIKILTKSFHPERLALTEQFRRTVISCKSIKCHFRCSTTKLILYIMAHLSKLTSHIPVSSSFYLLTYERSLNLLSFSPSNAYDVNKGGSDLFI